MNKGFLVLAVLVLLIGAAFILPQQKSKKEEETTSVLGLGGSPTPVDIYANGPTPTITPTPNPYKMATEITPLPSPIQKQTQQGQNQQTIQQQQQLETAQKATIKTSKGDIVLELYPQEAPQTVSNFVKKAKSGFYNNLTFHRVEDWVVQGGDPLGNGTGGGNMQTELNKRPFVVGSLGVARGGDIRISNDSQFFITKKEASWLNEQYTNYGTVTGGMDIAEKIAIGDKILGITVE